MAGVGLGIGLLAGARSFVLETDTWGNFIMTGYDYGSARDWARFGPLHLHDGVIAGERILPEGWVDFVRTPAPGDPTGNYGGLFWLNRGGAMDRVPEDAYWPAGFMGQLTLMIPSRDMVVVRLGPSPGDYTEYVDETIGRILEATGLRRPAHAAGGSKSSIARSSPGSATGVIAPVSTHARTR